MNIAPTDHDSGPRLPFRWMPLLLALAATALVSCPGRASAQGGGAPSQPAPVTVTLSARGEDVRAVLKAAFERAPGVKYRIEGGVRGVVTVAVRGVSLEAALRSIARANPEPLNVRRDGDTWVVAPRGSETATAAAAAHEPAATQDADRVTLDVRDARLPDVLATIFDRAPKDAPREAGARYRLADGAARDARVTARIAGLPLAAALDRLAAAARPRLAWRRTDEGVYEFRVPEGQTAASQTAPSAPPPPRVSVDVRDADVRSVLADLFRQAKVVNYAIANDVAGFLTLKIQDRALDDALDLVCRTAVPPLRYRKTAEGVYEVRVRTFGNAGAFAPAALEADPDAGSSSVASAASPWEAIPLMYAEADVLAGAMGALRPEGVTRVIGYLPTNTLIVRGGDPARDGFLTLVLGYGSRGGAAAGAGGTTGGGGGGATPGGPPAGSGGGGPEPANPGTGAGGGTKNP